MRGSEIKQTHQHDAGAYGRCSYCGRYSDDPNCLHNTKFICDCGKSQGYSGSFTPPNENSTWHGLIPLKEQSSGIAAVGVAEYGELETVMPSITIKHDGPHKPFRPLAGILDSGQNPYQIIEKFADNGEHSHYELMNSSGEIVWSEESVSPPPQAQCTTCKQYKEALASILKKEVDLQWFVENTKKMLSDPPPKAESWDEILTNAPVRVHPKTEEYFKGSFAVTRKP